MSRLSKEDYIHGGTQKDFYNEKEKVDINCPLCASKEFIVIDEDRGLGIVKCSKCSLIYTNPRPKSSEENYFGDAKIFIDEARLIFDNKKPHHRDKNYIYELNKIHKYKPNGKLLDIGTNMGFFLRHAKNIGYETVGVEPSPSLANIASEKWGLKIHNCFLENLPALSIKFDIITLIDVFEHVNNPKSILNKCHELLSEDGIVAIKVPNGDYNYFKMKLAQFFRKKNNFDIWDCCEHVVHYTPSTFTRMIESQGFKVKKYFIPLPINPPVWAKYVGHYYQYPSPFVLDWKLITLRKLFFHIGKIEKSIFSKSYFSPDLMFIIEKKEK